MKRIPWEDLTDAELADLIFAAVQVHQWNGSLPPAPSIDDIPAVRS